MRTAPLVLAFLTAGTAVLGVATPAHALRDTCAAPSASFAIGPIPIPPPLPPGPISVNVDPNALVAELVETDGCQFCSFEGSPTYAPGTYCDSYTIGFSWQGCAIWVFPVCVVGHIT